MCAINKEKILFLLILFFSIFVFKEYYPMTFFTPDAFKNPPGKVSSGHYRPMSDEEIFPGAFHTYWSGNSRNPFVKIQEKKKLPPASLELPKIVLPSKILLPPVPCPASSFWQPIGQINFSPLETDLVTLGTENLDRYLASKEEKIISPFSLKIKSLVKPQDTIFMKDGKRYKGKILSENSQEILLTTGESKASQNLLLPVSRILKIEKQISLEQVYQQSWKDLEEKDSKGFLSLAQSCEENGLPDLAQDFFQKVIRSFPSWDEAYLSYASFLRRRLDWDQAYQVYSLAKENGISQEAITMGMAEIIFAIGLKEKALRLLLPLRDFPSIVKALEFSFALKQEQTIESLLVKARALPLDQSQKKILLYWEALFALYKGDMETCLAYCKEYPEPLTPELENVKGISFYLQGKLGDACRSFTKAIEKRNVWAFYNLSLVYFMGGAYPQATGILKKILDIPEIVEDPSSVKAVLAYITFFSEPEKNYIIASQLLKEGQINNPQNPIPFYLLGEISRTQSSQQEVAIQNYQKALELDFQLHPALVALGVLSIQNNNLSDAIRYFQELLLRPLPSFLKADIHAYIALAYTANEEFLKAQEHIAQAYKMQENHTLALQISAWIANKRSFIPEALASLEVLLTKNPRDDYALKAKEEILENQGLFLWEEEFQREDSEKIRRQWQEVEQDGIDISLREQKAIFSGRSIRGNIPSFLLRSVDTQTFVALNADIFSEANMVYTGIIYGNLEGDCLYFGKNPQNQVVYAKAKPNSLIKWQNALENEKPVLWTETHSTVQLLRMRNEKNTYAFLLNGKILAKVIFEKEKPGKKDIGFFAFSETNLFWQLSIDNVKIIEKNP